MLTRAIVALLVCTILPLSGADTAALDAFRKQLPQPGSVLIDVEDARQLSAGVPQGSSSQSVPVVVSTGGPVGPTALQVTSAKAYDPDYQVQAFSPLSSGPVVAGDVIALTCWIRAAKTSGGASGVARLRLQQNTAPWDAPVEITTSCGEEWKLISGWGVAQGGYAQGTLQAAFHLGQQAQVIEIASLVVIDLGALVDRSRLPRTRLTWPGMEPDAPWRAEAARRIERFRMATLKIHVQDAQGNPVSGIPVHVQQKTRAFTFGSFVSFGKPIALLENSSDGEHTRDIFTRLFNRATCPVYWADWGWPSRKDDFLAIGTWLRAHGLTTRGHVLVYPAFHFLPHDLELLKSDPRRLQQMILDHIKEVAQATRSLGFREYDVTNELRDCVDLTRILGREAVAQWYAEARRDLPEAKMALNENTLLTNGGATRGHQDIYLDWYHFLAAHGQAPDVLGFQGHFAESLTGAEMIWSILDRFAAETSAEFQITEFDINTLDEEAQAAYTRDFFTACFAHPRICGITMWGFWEGDHWLPRAALWRKDWTPKSNGLVLEQLLTKDWWTDATVLTDAHGDCSVKAFLGVQHAEATVQGHQLHADITLDTPATTIPLKLSP
jgi:endo-1,4-beta-xylanase